VPRELAAKITAKNQNQFGRYVEECNEETSSEYQSKIATPQIEDIEEQQKNISEMIYDYLSLLAETPHSQDGNAFDIWEELPKGMSVMLGLSAYKDEEVEELLKELTSEFCNWLITYHDGCYPTSWGTIRLEDNINLYLSENTSQQIKQISINEYATAFDMERELTFEKTI
jgi:hypothetical protein